MPVLHARELTRLDGFKQYGLITSTGGHSWKTDCRMCFRRHPILSDPRDGMEVGENFCFWLLFFSRCGMDEVVHFLPVDAGAYFVDRMRATMRP